MRFRPRSRACARRAPILAFSREGLTGVGLRHGTRARRPRHPHPSLPPSRGKGSVGFARRLISANLPPASPQRGKGFVDCDSCLISGSEFTEIVRIPAFAGMTEIKSCPCIAAGMGMTRRGGDGIIFLGGRRDAGWRPRHPHPSLLPSREKGYVDFNSCLASVCMPSLAHRGPGRFQGARKVAEMSAEIRLTELASCAG